MHLQLIINTNIFLDYTNVKKFSNPFHTVFEYVFFVMLCYFDAYRVLYNSKFQSIHIKQGSSVEFGWHKSYSKPNMAILYVWIIFINTFIY